MTVVQCWLAGLGFIFALGAGASGAMPVAAPPPGQPGSTQQTGTSGPQASQPRLPLTPEQILKHVSRSRDWYRHLSPVEQLQVAAEDVVARDRLHQDSITALELAFDFGRACAAILDAGSRQQQTPKTGPSQGSTSSPATPPTGIEGQLDPAANGLVDRIAALQAQLAALDSELPRARAAERKTLAAQRAQVEAALTLAREVQGSIEDMRRFAAGTLSESAGNLKGLAAQIADLQKSVPEARRISRGSSAATSVTAAGTHGNAGGTSGAATGASEANGGGSQAGGATAGGSAGAGGTSAGADGAAAGTSASGSGTSSGGGAAPRSAPGGPGASAFRPESAGVIALATEWFAQRDTRRQLDGAINDTNSLITELEGLRSPLIAAVRTLVRGELQASTSTDPAQLLAQKQDLESDAARFRQLSTVLVPLGEQGITLEGARTTLQEWRNTLTAGMSTVTRYLVLRVGLLLASIVVVLVISEIWRRATFRYLHDTRRRRQFLLLRRVVVGVALTLVIVFGLVSEVGSIATYAGFVTAGVAVAMQNVILAIVAYFFLIGRYGVRVGERITLAGVTGRVIDIGLLRVSLMELAGPDLHPSGRIVVLSNAVLFQPSALFKQIPGASYVWHTITLTVTASADVQEAYERLQKAADKVYRTYSSTIEQQHAIVQRLVDFDTSKPGPQISAHLTTAGLECSVRYPVEPEKSAAIDQQMLTALREALEQDSRFKLVAEGAVTLKTDT